MTTLLRLLIAAVVALAATAPLQSAHARAPYTQAELDQLLAPIALYPDALLSQVLLAATRPQEVAEAARWSRANPGLEGDDAVRAVQFEDWDPSVKSLVAFPDLLARMYERLDWTEALGDAFFVQEPVVMETVQELRRRARAAGHLAPDERLQVQEDGGAIIIEPTTPQVVYVPYYDPWVVYGPWWWSAYPPVAWAPWPGYVLHRRPGIASGIWWGPAVGISIGYLYGSVDWYQRRVRIPVHRDYSRPQMMHRDPPHRRVAPASVAPAPRIEPRPQPRAERPYSRRDARPDIQAPEPRRFEQRAPAVIEQSPRLPQRVPETRQAATERTERATRREAQRIERAPQPQTVPPRLQQPQPHRADRVPPTPPQAAPAPRPQPQTAPAQSAQPQMAPALTAQPQHPQAARAEQAPRAAPQRAESAPKRNGREMRNDTYRGFARP